MMFIQASEFKDISINSPDVNYGFRIWDDYGASHIIGMTKQQASVSDLNVLALVVKFAQHDETAMIMLVETRDAKNSININGKEYGWNVIEPIITSAGQEIPASGLVDPVPSGEVVKD